MRISLLLNGPILGLILLSGCAATQAEPGAAPIAPPATQAVVIEKTADAPASEAAPAGKELSLLEIFPVQPVTRKSSVANSGHAKPAANAGDNVVLNEPPGEALIAEKAAAGEVWVNAKSGAFHQPGTQFYAKTKKGFFLPEAEAIKQGFRGVKGQ